MSGLCCFITLISITIMICFLPSFQESLFLSERCPPPPNPRHIKSLSPSPLFRHKRRSSKGYIHGRPSISCLQPPTIPLITKTGPNTCCNQQGPGGLITVIRQHSQPETSLKSACCQYACCSSRCVLSTKYCSICKATTLTEKSSF